MGTPSRDLTGGFVGGWRLKASGIQPCDSGAFISWHSQQPKSRKPCLFLIALLAFFSGDSAKAASWREAIERVRIRAHEYHERATALGWSVHAGTMYNELDIPRHS